MHTAAFYYVKEYKVSHSFSGCNISRILPRSHWPSCFDLPRSTSLNLRQFGRDGKHFVKLSSAKMAEEFQFSSAKSIFIGLWQRAEPYVTPCVLKAGCPVGQPV